MLKRQIQVKYSDQKYVVEVVIRNEVWSSWLKA
jgi:hypothetical protein